MNDRHENAENYVEGYLGYASTLAGPGYYRRSAAHIPAPFNTSQAINTAETNNFSVAIWDIFLPAMLDKNHERKSDISDR